jgi:trk system potassium uptake protein TrkH
MFIGKKISLHGKLSLRENLAQIDLSDIKWLLKNIIKLTVICESVGAVVLTLAFTKYFSFGEAVWKGIFHSVSAFCNAGFDIINIGNGSMTPFADNPIILLTISALIIIGGIGFLVVSDVMKNKRFRKLSLHTKIVLLMTLILLVGGTALFLGAEYNNEATIGNMNFGGKLLNSFFQSVTCRTAGFNSIDTASLSRLSMPVAMALMFVGASPGSTGGGLKTTTLFIMLMTIGTTVLRQKETVVGYKKIGQETQTKATAVLMLAFMIFIGSFFLLLITEPELSNLEIVFEQISAYATVGLSLGITTKLSVLGKLIIITNMFLGRLGALTFLLAFPSGANKLEAKIKYPDANINI